MSLIWFYLLCVCASAENYNTNEPLNIHVILLIWVFFIQFFFEFDCIPANAFNEMGLN